MSRFRASGRFHAAGLVRLLPLPMGGVAAGAIYGGIAFTFLLVGDLLADVVGLPIGDSSWLLAPLLSVLVVLAVARLVRRQLVAAHSRSRLVAVAAGIVVGGVAAATKWVVNGLAMIAIFQMELPWTAVFDPGMAHAFVDEAIHWTWDAPPENAASLVQGIWQGELLVLALAPVGLLLLDRPMPYCERCERWVSADEAALVVDLRASRNIHQLVRSWDVEALAALPPPDYERLDQLCHTLVPYPCPVCEEFLAIEVQRWRRRLDPETGRWKLSRQPVGPIAVIEPSQFDALVAATQ